MKQSARKRHKNKNINISRKRHIKKRYTRKLYKTKASGLREDNERRSEYERLLQKYKTELAKWQAILTAAEALVANQSLSSEMHAHANVKARVAKEAVRRYQRAVVVIERKYTEAVQKSTSQAATKIQAATRGKTTRSKVAAIKIEAAADAKELAEALAAIEALEALEAIAVTKKAATKKAASVKSLLSSSPKDVSEISDTFSYIKGLLTTKKTKNIEAYGNRYDPLGKQVLFLTFQKYIQENGGRYANTFLTALELTIDKEFTKTRLGVDVATYIEFNINILCPVTQLPIQTNTKVIPFWTAHISMVDDGKLGKTGGDPRFLSHITFIYCITPCKNESSKLITLHVFRNTIIEDPLPNELKNLPSEIDRKRLQIFKDLVFSFLDNHRTQLTEASNQDKYEKSKKSDKEKFDKERKVYSAVPVTSSRKAVTRSVSGRFKEALGRKFTLKTSSHKTRYDKKKRKTIKSTQKNKRRK